MIVSVPYGLGAKLSPRDYRTVSLGTVKATPTSFPDNFSLNVSNIPVWNQKMLGACVGHGSGGIKMYQEITETKSLVNISPRFIYALCKSIDGLKGDVGTYPIIACKVLQKYGVCTERYLPNDTTLSYDDYIDLSKITPEAYEEAKQYAISGYAQVFPQQEDSLRQGIMEGGVGVTMGVDKQWWTDKNGNYSFNPKDIFPLRQPKEGASYHYIYIHSWETIGTNTRLYWFRNSWSDQWGRVGNGCFIFNEYKSSLMEGWTFIDLPNSWQEQLKNQPPANKFNYTFPVNINITPASGKVLIKNLQLALKIDGAMPQEFNECDLGIYGPKTRQAVKNYQINHKIASLDIINSINGRWVGPDTQKYLNKYFSK